MIPDQVDQVRDAALGVALECPSLSLESVAVRANVIEEDLGALAHDEDSLIRFMLQPLVDAVDSLLRELPIHKSPTPEQQRETLAAILEASTLFPRQSRLTTRLLASEQYPALSRRADQFAYQAGIRLLGVNYEADSDAMTRVYFVTEMLLMAVCTHRHDFTDLRTRELLLDSLMGALNPPKASVRQQERGRRWTDNSPDEPHTSPA